MNEDKYLQNQNTGLVYKVMKDYLLQMSPWNDGDNRRIYEVNTDNYDIITYQNACMIVNKQFNDIDEEWEHKGKKYRARALTNKSIDEHIAMLNMLPSHYIKESKLLLQHMPNDNIISIQDQNGNEFKMVKHKGKIYYMLIINQILPKVKLYNTFGQFCQIVNIKNVKPILNETDKKYI